MMPSTVTYRCEDKWVVVDRKDIGRTAGRRWFIFEGRPWIEVISPLNGHPERHPAASWIVGQSPVRLLDGDQFNLRRENIFCLGRYVEPKPIPDPIVRLNRTGFRGVSFDERMDLPYRAMISHKNKKAHIGWYATAVEAAMAYDVEARKKTRGRIVCNFEETAESTDIQPADPVEADIPERKATTK